jgi:hypothetical protein
MNIVQPGNIRIHYEVNTCMEYQRTCMDMDSLQDIGINRLWSVDMLTRARLWKHPWVVAVQHDKKRPDSTD